MWLSSVTPYHMAVYLVTRPQWVAAGSCNIQKDSIKFLIHHWHYIICGRPHTRFSTRYSYWWNHIPDNKDHRIDIKKTSIRVGSISDRCRSEAVCYLGWWIGPSFVRWPWTGRNHTQTAVTEPMHHHGMKIQWLSNQNRINPTSTF